MVSSFNLWALDSDKDAPERNSVGMFIDISSTVFGKNGNTVTKGESQFVINMKLIVKSIAKRNSMSREEVLALSDYELTDMIRDWSYQDGSHVDEAIENAIIIKNLTNLSNDEAVYNSLDRQTQGFPIPRKIGLLATLLDNTLSNYNYDRIGSDSPGYDGEVSMRTLLGTWRNTLISNKDLDAGVCRDMHQAAIQLAARMGLPDSFTVGYAVPGNGHRTAIFTHADERGTTYRLNYGRQSKFEGVAGPTALRADDKIPESGVAYSINNSAGSQAISLPTDLGAMLNSGTGGEDSNLDILYVNRNQMNRFGIRTPIGNISAFHGSAEAMGNGDQVMGVAYNGRLAYKDYIWAELGMAGFTAKRDIYYGSEVSNNGFFLRLDLGASIPFYETENVRVDLFHTLNGRGMISGARGGQYISRRTTPDGSLTFKKGVDVKYKTGENSRHRTIFGIQSNLGDKNASDKSQGLGHRADTYYLSHATQVKLSKNVNAKFMAGLFFRNLGPENKYLQYRVNSEFDFTKSGTRLNIGSEGAIQNSTPIWLPGSERVGMVGVDQKLPIQGVFQGRQLYISARGQQSLEKDMFDNRLFTLGFGGTF